MHPSEPILDAGLAEPFVSFVLVSSLKGLCFNPHRPEPLVFTVGVPETSVTIRSKNAPESHDHGFDNLECKAHVNLATNPDNVAFVQGLCRGTYVAISGAPVKLPVRVKGQEWIDREGRFLVNAMLPFELCPSGVQDLWRSARSHLLETQDRFLRLLRWTQDTDGPPDLYHSMALYWRVGTEGQHHLAPDPATEDDDFNAGIGGIIWSTPEDELLHSLWPASEIAEPLAYELLREARLLASTGSFRSALLMAATAVETGVKDHVSRQRPQTSWIFSKLQSPPIYRVLRDYLPEVHSDTTIISDWKLLRPLWKRVQDLGEARNDIAHTGRAVPSSLVSEYLVLARDVLYLLDALAGRDWARQHLSSNIKNVLGWPHSRYGRLRARFRITQWEIDDTA